MSRCAGSSPVVVPPGKALCDKLLGREALHELDDLEVGHSRDLGVLLQVEVLLRIEDALCSITACLLDAYRAGDGLRPVRIVLCNSILRQGHTEALGRHSDGRPPSLYEQAINNSWHTRRDACSRTRRIRHQAHCSSIMMQPACLGAALTLEEVLVHLLAVLLWDEHDCWCRSLSASAQGQLDSW